MVVTRGAGCRAEATHRNDTGSGLGRNRAAPIHSKDIRSLTVKREEIDGENNSNKLEFWVVPLSFGSRRQSSANAEHFLMPRFFLKKVSPQAFFDVAAKARQ